MNAYLSFPLLPTIPNTKVAALGLAGPDFLPPLLSSVPTTHIPVSLALSQREHTCHLQHSAQVAVSQKLFQLVLQATEGGKRGQGAHGGIEAAEKPEGTQPRF